MKRIGFYCWAGPDTIKMLNLKFFNPEIDSVSLMESYDYDYLKKLKETFGITDFWAMYSWGFSDASEKDQRDFLLSKLENFKKLGIKVHAYVQGPNVVYSEFPDKDWYCKDENDQFITYYRGRRVVCLNNPEFVDYKLKQIEKMLNSGFDGIYMDNIQMGQMAIPTYSQNLPYVFAGCNCEYCKKLFRTETGFNIPLNPEAKPEVTKRYLEFRKKNTTNFLTKISKLVHSANLEFGTNSFDPKFNTEYVFGTNLNDLDKLQDYFLFENHSLPNNKENNAYIKEVTKNLTKPVFVVSYKKGIGFDGQYSQKDFDDLYTEANADKFNECIKGCEYFTNGKWHNLYVDRINKPHLDSDLDIKPKRINNSTEKFIEKYAFTRLIVRRLYNRFFTLFMENKFARHSLLFLTQIAIR